MSSGFLSISFRSTKIEGEFKNGVLTNGTTEVPGYRYKGTFNEYGMLHGKGEQIDIGRNILYSGTFENGKFVEGETYKDNKLIEIGKFECKGVNPYLIEGKKITNNGYVLEGKFQGGSIVEGIANYKDEVIYKGIFTNGIMNKGSVMYKDINFYAEYDLSYDTYHIRSVIKNCKVVYDGNINLLNKAQLKLLLCQGNFSAEASNFYDIHLINYGNNIVKYLSAEMFPQLHGEMFVGFRTILENVEKCKDKFIAIDGKEINNKKMDDKEINSKYTNRQMDDFGSDYFRNLYMLR
jgi:hypothetical protein